MLKVNAKIILYSGEAKRQTPLKSGYRPLFEISNETKVSGLITLLDRAELKPGDEAIVEIQFANASCVKGAEFRFYESVEALGEASVLEVLS